MRYLVHDWGATIHHHRPDACLVCELPGLIIDLTGELTGRAEHQSQWVCLRTWKK